jgi:hypothetical protein
MLIVEFIAACYEILLMKTILSRYRLQEALSHLFHPHARDYILRRVLL